MTLALGAMVAARPVSAWDPAAHAYRAMVQISAGAWALPLMEALLAGNGSCRVQGMAFPVLRFTHTREAPHRLGQQPSQVDDFQTAAAESRACGVVRGLNSLELTLRRMNAG